MSAARALAVLALAAGAAGAALLVAAAPPAARSWWHDAPSQPERFAEGVISTAAEETALAVTPDGAHVFFGRSRLWFPAARISTIQAAARVPGGFGTPVPASFSQGYSDIDPFVLRDGSALLFASMRPVDGRPRKDFDLWLVPIEGDRIGSAQHLGPAVNSPDDDLFPSVDAEGTLYFGSERAGGLGGWDIWRARRGADGRWRAAENLGAPVNGSGWEFNPTIAPDGRFLVFTALGREGGRGLGDLWIAERGTDDRFGTPRPLGGGVNTEADEYHPTLSPDGRTLFFVRRDARRGQSGDLYWVALDAVLAATPGR